MDHLQVTQIFNELFAQRHNTLMRGGADEPLYVPAGANAPAWLIFRDDFAASALHEAAHWCIAGVQRRRQLDFGYNYQPPPRCAEAQALFFKLELKVQTLEKLFAERADVRFSPSADNLQADVKQFAHRIEQHRACVTSWMDTCGGTRARQLYEALGAVHV